MLEKFLVLEIISIYIIISAISAYLILKIIIKIDAILEAKERAKVQRAKAQRAEAQKRKNLKAERSDMFQMLKKF